MPAPGLRAQGAIGGLLFVGSEPFSWAVVMSGDEPLSAPLKSFLSHTADEGEGEEKSGDEADKGVSMTFVGLFFQSLWPIFPSLCPELKALQGEGASLSSNSNQGGVSFTPHSVLRQGGDQCLLFWW